MSNPANPYGFVGPGEYAPKTAHGCVDPFDGTTFSVLRETSAGREILDALEELRPDPLDCIAPPSAAETVEELERVTLKQLRDGIGRSGLLTMVTMCADRWIPVDERLPMRGEAVLGVVAGLCRIMTCWDFDGWEEIDGLRYANPVTHWRPLPPPPTPC